MSTCSAPDGATRTKFHMSLSVSDLRRSVDFYSVLFGVQPAKSFHDYAKFELDEPPLIFSITPHPPGPAGGILGHAGLKVSSREAIEVTYGRLIEAGYCVQCQDGATCGYRKQDKIHVSDPDGTQWEVYVVESDVAPDSVDRSLEGTAARLEPSTGPVVWEHYITNNPPERIPYDDASVDEVRLVGTFNANLTDEQQRLLVVDARRALKPGGKVLVHGLMADRPFSGGPPKLPGLAALVSQVPPQSVPLDMLQTAGFVGLHITRFSEKPWFCHDGVELREVKIIGWQPAHSTSTRRVLYKGPLAEVMDEAGTVFPRGQRVEVSDSTWDQLRRSAAADQFLFLDLSSTSSSCSI